MSIGWQLKQLWYLVQLCFVFSELQYMKFTSIDKTTSFLIDFLFMNDMF